jgi:predicted nucleic acid-binding protein
MTATYLPDDAGHESSSGWLERMARTGHRLVAPSILLTEVAAAVTKSTGNVADARWALDDMLGLIEIHAVGEALATRAGEIAAAHGIRGCDAIYIALAESLGEELVTLDDQQLARGAAVVRTRKP